jgi:hypothetical protein
MFWGSRTLFRRGLGVCLDAMLDMSAMSGDTAINDRCRGANIDTENLRSHNTVPEGNVQTNDERGRTE